MAAPLFRKFLPHVFLVVWKLRKRKKSENFENCPTYSTFIQKQSNKPHYTYLTLYNVLIAPWSDEEEWGHEGSDLGSSDEDELSSTENRSVDAISSCIGDEVHEDGAHSDEDSDGFGEEDEEDEIILSPELQSIKGMTHQLLTLSLWDITNLD